MISGAEHNISNWFHFIVLVVFLYLFLVYGCDVDQERIIPLYVAQMCIGTPSFWENYFLLGIPRAGPQSKDLDWTLGPGKIHFYISSPSSTWGVYLFLVFPYIMKFKWYDTEPVILISTEDELLKYEGRFVWRGCPLDNSWDFVLLRQSQPLLLRCACSTPRNQRFVQVWRLERYISVYLYYFDLGKLYLWALLRRCWWRKFCDWCGIRYSWDNLALLFSSPPHQIIWPQIALFLLYMLLRHIHHNMACFCFCVFFFISCFLALFARVFLLLFFFCLFGVSHWRRYSSSKFPSFYSLFPSLQPYCTFTSHISRETSFPFYSLNFCESAFFRSDLPGLFWFVVFNPRVLIKCDFNYVTPPPPGRVLVEFNEAICRAFDLPEHELEEYSKWRKGAGPPPDQVCGTSFCDLPLLPPCYWVRVSLKTHERIPHPFHRPINTQHIKTV